jgi:hypothetical protein
MFGLFKSNPIEKLEKQYKSLLEQGVHAQRNGDIRTYSELTSQADEVLKKIDELKAQA